MKLIDQQIDTSVTDTQALTYTQPAPRPSGRPRVVVVGAGFGGMSVARSLARANVDVLVLDRNNYHGFWPLLYQVATAGLEPESIAYPARAILRKYANADFLMAEVKGVDFERRLVLRLKDAFQTGTSSKKMCALRFSICCGSPSDAVAMDNGSGV